MARARPSQDTLSMSFLDVLSCALGATVLLYLVLSSSARSNTRPHEAGEATPIPVMLEVDGPPWVTERVAMSCFGDYRGLSIAGSRISIEWVDDDMRRRVLAEVRATRSMSRFTVRGRLEERIEELRFRDFSNGDGTGSVVFTRRKHLVLVRDYSITPIDQNASTVPNLDPRDPNNTILTWYCRPSVYLTSWPRSPHLERLEVDQVWSSSSVGRWLAPAFNVRRKHELRVCGQERDPTITLRVALSGVGGQQCAEETAPYIDGCYRAIFEQAQWSTPSEKHCLAPQT